MSFLRDLISGSIKAENQRLNEDRERIAELEWRLECEIDRANYWAMKSTRLEHALQDIIEQYEHAKHNSVKRIVRIAKEGLE